MAEVEEKEVDFNDKYKELLEMKNTDPEKAQEEMRKLAIEYTDKDLANLWGVSPNKVGFLRRELGISKNSAGDIQAIYPPGSYDSKKGFKREVDVPEKEKEESLTGEVMLQMSDLTKAQIQQFMGLVDSLPDGHYDLKIVNKSLPSQKKNSQAV